MFRYDANGLALDLETVTLRFEERAAASKPPLKPNKAMLAKMKSLANHLRTLPLDSCGQDGAEQKMLTHRSQRTWQRSRCRLLRSSLRQSMRHARFLSRSVLHEYLSGPKYADEPYATAARFGLKPAHVWMSSKLCLRSAPRNSETRSTRLTPLVRVGCTWRLSNSYRLTRGGDESLSEH